MLEQNRNNDLDQHIELIIEETSTEDSLQSQNIVKVWFIKVGKLFEKLEQELRFIDSMEESSHNQIQTKAEHYKRFLDKKLKLLPENSYILLNAEGSWSILLGKVKNDLKMLLKREAVTRKRLQIMELLDGGNRSRLRGFDLFRLYHILEQRLMMSGIEETESLKMTESLLESYFLLRHDLLSGDLAIRVREAVERAWQGIADTVEEDGTIRNIIGGNYDNHYLHKIPQFLLGI